MTISEGVLTELLEDEDTLLLGETLPNVIQPDKELKYKGSMLQVPPTGGGGVVTLGHVVKILNYRVHNCVTKLTEENKRTTDLVTNIH